MGFVYPVRACATAAIAATCLFSGSLFADAESASEPKRIASQDFENYQGDYNRRGWGIIDDLDIVELLDDEGFDKLNHSAKAMFTAPNALGENKLKFDVQWTRKTLAKMYPEKWAEIKAADTRKERKQMIRALRTESCDAQMEVGYARTYGINSENNVLEMDSHATAGCPGARVGTSRMRTFVPTVPGAEYLLTVKYQKRDYNYRDISEKQAYRDLVVRIDTNKTKLPLAAEPGEVLESGFKVATIPFTASRFYTKLQMRDSGHPDTFGILIDSVAIDETKGNPRNESCTNYFGTNKKQLRKCLTGDFEPATMGCDLEHEAHMEWVRGERTSNNARRSLEENIFNTTTSKFLSLGSGGQVRFKLKSNGMRAACPIAGKTLRFDEVTFNNTYDTYPEQASVKVKLVGCSVSGMNGWNLLESETQAGMSIVTNESFSYEFGEDYNSCRVAQILIKDHTHELSDHPRYVRNGDGVDLYNLAIVADE